MEKRQKFCLKTSKRKLALCTINSALNNIYYTGQILVKEIHSPKPTVKNIITTLAMQYTVSSWQPNVNKHQPITFKT